jgi:predicted SpoU family rRNA methylase
MFFVCGRGVTCTWFDIFDWNLGTTGQPLSGDQLERAALWVDLSRIRVGADATITLRLLGTAFIPAARAEVLEPSSGKDG